ncbi:MAG TPA: hypothetical protein V6C81_00655 [Planktothrix sp.]|jgi:hypothetical protein
MEGQSTKDRLKFAGGAIIVAAAFAIMMPGILDYVGRIGRVIILIVLALATALAVVWGKNLLLNKKKAPTSATTGDGDNESTQG